MQEKTDFSLSWNSRRLYTALVLMAIAVMMPLIFTEHSFHVYSMLYHALERKDTGVLLESALRLIALNTLRSTPSYLGAMLLMESVEVRRNARSIPFIQLPFCVLLHMLLYRIIYYIYGIDLDVGVLSLLVFFCMELLNRFSFRLHNKLIIIILFLIMIQGLDIMPGMTRVGFGSGEIAMDIKAAAQILQAERLLTTFSLLLLFTFAVATLLTALLDQDQRQLIRAHQKARQDEQELYQARMDNLKMRSFREIQNLVHDLKSPLTAIQGLAGLTESLLQDEKLAEYQRRIIRASERMDKMVSEILHEECMSATSTERLVESALSCMSTNPVSARITVDNRCPDVVISVNAIRMTRALVNLLDNACKAIDPESGTVRLTVVRQEGWTQWEVWDDGHGIAPEILDEIWQRGYSASNSTGLGLAFVTQVVQLHRGEIKLESEQGSYTRVVMRLPDEGGQADGNSYPVH